MRKPLAVLAALAVTASVATVLSVSALAGTAPSVSGLSTHRAAYWGGTSVTVYGTNFSGRTTVKFGSSRAWSVRVTSPTRLVVQSPYHRYGKVNIRVSTPTGTSPKNKASQFTFARPGMSDKIQGGLTGSQEKRLSKKIRARHRTPGTARGSSRWTAAMGLTAARRATSWLGLPYSWAGGNSSGPTKGVCSHNGGDLDCKIVGFDCSGLTLYAWAPYRAMAHYAATQRSRAGRFHPGLGELVAGDLVFFSGYIAGGVGHVAIYVGNGYVVQAEQSGSTVKRDLLTDVIASHGTYRGATRPTSTGRQGAPPVVNGVTPTLSTSGGLVTVTGSNLASATAVTVSGKQYYSFSRSANRLVVRVPAHAAGVGGVSISNAWGTVKRTVTYVAPPTLGPVNPSTGPVAGGNTVTLTGQNLATATNVVVGSAVVPFTRVSATTLTVVMPAHLAGGVPVVVTSPYGNSAAQYYTYVDSGPTTSPSASRGSATPRSTPTSHAPTSPSPTTSASTTPPASTSAPTTASAPPSSASTTPTSLPTTSGNHSPPPTGVATGSP